MSKMLGKALKEEGAASAQKMMQKRISALVEQKRGQVTGKGREKETSRKELDVRSCVAGFNSKCSRKPLEAFKRE